MKAPLTIREHQMIMLDMMVEFDHFCQERGLRYFMAYGTLLGAVRHHGFIPWDDDVDIVMPRADYEILREEDHINENIDVVSFQNPHQYYHPFCASVIADKRTIMKEMIVKHQTGKGVFCDIFPMDGVPKPGWKRKMHIEKLQILQTIVSNALNVEPGFTSIKNSIKTLLSKVFARTDIVIYSKKLDDLAKSIPYENSDSVLCSVAFDHAPDRFLTPIEEYSSYIMMDFEGYQLRAPVGYEAILRRLYGDYMQLPPEEERSGHHGIEIYQRSKL